MQNVTNPYGMKIDTEINSSVLSSCACFRKLHGTISCCILYELFEAFFSLHEKLALRMQLKLKSIVYLSFMPCLSIFSM